MLINVIGTVELIERQQREVLCICEVAVVTLSFLLYFHSCLLCGRALHETPCFGSREIVMRGVIRTPVFASVFFFFFLASQLLVFKCPTRFGYSTVQILCVTFAAAPSAAPRVYLL